MKREEIFAKVKEILETSFEIPKETVTLASRFIEDLDLDSIDAVDLIVKLQNFTDKRIDPETFKKVRTVEDVVEVIYALVNHITE